MVALPSARRSFLWSGLAIAIALAACRPAPDSAPNRVIKQGGDVMVSGATPTVGDSTDGDVMMAGSTLVFTGATGGDYLGAGGEQTVGGRIHGSVRAAGGFVRVGAAIGRNVSLAGGTVILDTAATVERNVYAAGGKVQLFGRVHGGVRASGGIVSIDGVIDGDVTVFANELQVGPNTRIGGTLRYRVPTGKAHIDPGARIVGMVTALPMPSGWGIGRVFWVLWVLGFLVAGVVVVALAPGLAANASTLARNRLGYATLIGLLCLVALTVGIVVVAITIIGLPLALLAGATCFVLYSLGRVVAAVWVGRMILRQTGETARGAMLVNFLVGAVIMAIVGLIPVLGSLAVFIATLLGFGALLLTLKTLWGPRPAVL